MALPEKPETREEQYLNGIAIGGTIPETPETRLEQYWDYIAKNGGGGGEGTRDYTQLFNKPKINNTELTGNKSISDLGLQGALTAGTNITIDNGVISATSGGEQIQYEELPTPSVDLLGKVYQYVGEDVITQQLATSRYNGHFYKCIDTVSYTHTLTKTGSEAGLLTSYSVYSKGFYAKITSLPVDIHEVQVFSVENQGGTAVWRHTNIDEIVDLADYGITQLRFSGDFIEYDLQFRFAITEHHTYSWAHTGSLLHLRDGEQPSSIIQNTCTTGNQCSAALGYRTAANGYYSLSEGCDTIANAHGTHAEGQSTFADSVFSHVQGRFNIQNTAYKYAHIVGNGFSTDVLSNAHTLDWDGNSWYQGEIKIGGTSWDDTDAKLVATQEYVGTKTGNLSELETTSKSTLVSAINEVDSIAKGANQAIAYNNYETLVTTLNAMDEDELNAGQNLMVVTLNVPDLWVQSVETESIPYTYTTDQAIIDALETDGYIRIGYYKLSQLETQKVDLTNYVENTDYASTSAAGVIKFENGYGVKVAQSGNILSDTMNYATYGSADNDAFVSKGTLENVITGKGLDQKTKVLTAADYNWPTDNPNRVALWLLDDGLYTAENGTQISPATGINMSLEGAAIVKKYISNSQRGHVVTLSGDSSKIYTSIDANGNASFVYNLITTITNNLTSTSTSNALSADQGRVLKNLIDSLVIQGTGAPKTSTTGTVGKLYEDTTNGKLYQCTAVSGSTYTWTEVGGCGGGPTVVQNTGTSTTDVMSQDATTKMIYPFSGNKKKIVIGDNITSDSNYRSLFLGYGINHTSYAGQDKIVLATSSYAGEEIQPQGDKQIIINSGGASSVNRRIMSGSGAVAIGSDTLVSADYSVAMGSKSTATTSGEFSIGGSSLGTNGYNSTSYRLLTNVHDPVNAHDAATKGYVDSHAGGGGTWGSITGTLSDQTDLQNALDTKQNLTTVTNHTLYL